MGLFWQSLASKLWILIFDSSKEPHGLSKEPYILSKEPFLLSKEPYILPTEL